MKKSEVYIMNQNNVFPGFLGRVTVAHFLTYFLMGIIFAAIGFNVIVYYEQNPDPLVNAFFRPTTSLWVVAGPLFQVLRGALIALTLYPFRKVFLENKWGWIYLWGIFLSLAILVPSGAAPGSMEGVIYTTLPFKFHLIGLPEIILQTLAFSWLVVYWENHQVKKLSIPLIVVFALLTLVLVLGLVLNIFFAS
jgi:hypothetical protein